MRLVYDTGQRVQVTPYSGIEYMPLNDIPVGTCITAYDNPENGEVILLLFGQSLYLGDRMDHSLVNPNQMRHNGNEVHDVPKQFQGRHEIVLTGTNGQPSLTIPLVLTGVVSGFHTRLPTDAELDSDCREYWATSPDLWEPSSEFLEVAEPLRTIPVAHPSCTHRISEVSIANDGLLYHRLTTVNHTVIGDHDNHDENTRTIDSVATTVTRRVVTPEELAKKWSISLDIAKNTLKASTQKGIRLINGPVHRRFQSQPFRNKRILPGKWYSDTAFFKVKGLNNETCAQVTGNGFGYARFYPLRTKSCCSHGLVDLINNDGIPEKLIVDNSKEQGESHAWLTEWRRVVHKYDIHQTPTEPYSWWQNMIEGEIREIKRGIKHFTQWKQSPRRLWTYLGAYVVVKRSLTALPNPVLQGRTPFERVKGYTPDITLYTRFEWYDWVYYLDNDGDTLLARWLGHAEGVGAGDCFWLLPKSCHPIINSTVWAVPIDDLKTEQHRQQRDEFDKVVQEKIGDGVPKGEQEAFAYDLPDYGDLFIEEGFDGVSYDEPEASAPDVDDFTNDAYDQYLLAEVLLPVGDERVRGVVKRRAKDQNGNPIGIRNDNPLLDTRQYEVELPDGSVEVYTSNILAENLYSQVDEEGRTFRLIEEIVDHRSDGNAIRKDDGFYVSRNGEKRRKPTTKGWHLLVSWRDGTSSWVKLSDLKESYPVQTAEYAVNNRISDEPAFAWWVNHILRKRKRIIEKVKTKYWERSHKYGIRLPKTVEEALRIDKETGTDFWRKAIEKEMKNVRVAFEFSDGDLIPVAHKELTVHMIFDVKITLERKARLVADGHKTEKQPKEHTFSSVVSRDSVRIFFMLAALNNLNVYSADIQNAYLTAPIREKYWVRAGPEFGSDVGRPAKVVRALYGLETAGQTFRSHLAATLKGIGFKPSKADPDVWMRPAVKTCGEKYYEYILCYVDDIIGASVQVDQVFEAIGKVFKFKETPQEPTMYLGADIRKRTIQDSDDPTKIRWGMSSTSYTKKAIQEVERELAEVSKCLPSKVTTPLKPGYRPEIDATPELDYRRLNYYQGLIGVLRWICELGRLDILVAVSLMSRYLVSAREGHLEQLFHIFAYLKQYGNSTLVFDDTEPQYDARRFQIADWTEYYGEEKELSPPDAPEPRGKHVTTTCFVDADHAGCLATRRSHTGVLIFVNRAPVSWYSKRQNTVETSTFGSEIVALRIAIEMVEGLRYKLRMMGVPMDGPTSVFCDNESVVKNTTRPESALKKKHNAVAYHKVRESIANGTIRLAKEDGKSNLADILTKLMPGPRLREMIQMVLW
jgi:hypothetical protein